ncbi:hypothetical protein SESBI_32119 [Sesbania bispinosa]|nr:hypothetical protein SESBI_32119 [Sesbania bispinosa]
MRERGTTSQRGREGVSMDCEWRERGSPCTESACSLRRRWRRLLQNGGGRWSYVSV